MENKPFFPGDAALWRAFLFWLALMLGILAAYAVTTHVIEATGSVALGVLLALSWVTLILSIPVFRAELAAARLARRVEALEDALRDKGAAGKDETPPAPPPSRKRFEGDLTRMRREGR